MSAKLWPTSTINAFSTSLDGAINDTDVSITLTSVTGLDTAGGILVIDRVNASGTATPSQREYVSYTGITTKTLTGATRGLAGSTAQDHASGAIVEGVFTVTHWIDLVDFLEAEHDADGTHGAITPTSVNIGASTLVDGVLDEDNMASDSATKLATQQSIKAYVDPTVTSVASDTTPNPTGGDKHNELYITALAGAAEFQAPSGTPANGNMLIIRVKDDGTARALTYNAIYSGIVDTLPATTTISKVLYMGFIYNSTSSKWELVALAEES